MSTPRRSLDANYFEAMYRRDTDPWSFRTSAYERDKYSRTMGLLTRDRYRSGLEIGCSIGVLTSSLAQKCDRLLAVDASVTALAAAIEANAARVNVEFRTLWVPTQWPQGSYDLLVLSEVLYYLDRGDLSRLGQRVRESLALGGEIVMVHWTGETDYPLSGDAAAEHFLAEISGFAAVEAQERHPSFRMERLRRR